MGTERSPGPSGSEPHLPTLEVWRSAAYGPGSPGAFDSPFGSGGFWGFLRRRWVIILAGTVLVFGSVLAATFLLPQRYEANATFLVERPQQTGSTEALAMLERLGQVRNTETESELLRGRRVVEPAVDELDLHVVLDGPGVEEGLRPADVFPVFEAGRDAVPGLYRIQLRDESVRVTDFDTGALVAEGSAAGPIEFAGIRVGLPPEMTEFPLIQILPFEQAVGSAQGRISASPTQREADVVRLTCNASSAREAVELCRGVQDSYLALRSELQRAEAAAAASFLADQVARVRLQLNEAEDSLQQYQEFNQAVALDEQATQGVQQSAAFQTQRRELMAERNALAALIADIESEEGDAGKYRRLASFPSFLRSNDHVVSQLVGSLVDLEDRRADLAVRRTEADPELAAVDARIEQIERQLLGIADGYQKSLSAQIASLAETIDEQGRDLAAVPERQLAAARFERQVTVLEDLYSYLQGRLQEAQVAEAVTLPSVRVVDEPSRPVSPSFPNVPLNTALGMFLGVGTGLLGGLWRERTDQRVRDRGELLEWGMPILSMIPPVRRDVFSVSGRESSNRFLPGSGGAAPERREIAREAFRSLAFEIDEIGQRIAEEGVVSIAVSSASRGDGKTFCASNLAIQSALAGKRTLLIDADLRAKGVGRLFGIPAGQPGLGDLIRGRLEPRDVVVTLDVGEGVTLDVMPSSQEPDSSPRLVVSTLRGLIREAEKRYDMVIVDTPPLNVLPDAAQVATTVGGVVLVVRSGVTERAALDLAVERLARVRARVFGVVLNEIDLPDYYSSYSVVDRGGHA